jgi:hypothetical protein
MNLAVYLCLNLAAVSSPSWAEREAATVALSNMPIEVTEYLCDVSDQLSDVESVVRIHRAIRVNSFKNENTLYVIHSPKILGKLGISSDKFILGFLEQVYGIRHFPSQSTTIEISSPIDETAIDVINMLSDRLVRSLHFKQGCSPSDYLLSRLDCKNIDSLNIRLAEMSVETFENLSDVRSLVLTDCKFDVFDMAPHLLKLKQKREKRQEKIHLSIYSSNVIRSSLPSELFQSSEYFHLYVR